MFSYDFQVRVRYGETDKMGYLYYGRYLDYFEVGRVEMLRALGLSYQQMEDEHRIMLPVVNVSIRYRQPLYYDDVVTIRTMVREMPDKFITFHYELFGSNGALANEGMVQLCFVSSDNRRPCRAPAFLKDALKLYL